jgi:hypothetical protein
MNRRHWNAPAAALALVWFVGLAGTPPSSMHAQALASPGAKIWIEQRSVIEEYCAPPMS